MYVNNYVLKWPRMDMYRQRKDNTSTLGIPSSSVPQVELPDCGARAGSRKAKKLGLPEQEIEA